jgi:predicted Rossmann-fold nucleotide-binding protein
VILYNINGFWNSMIAMLDDMEQRRMIRGQWLDYIQVADSLEMLTALL